jgi:putative CocE/NonD family hydrolase
MSSNINFRNFIFFLILYLGVGLTAQTQESADIITQQDDYEIREVMIPMRDGIKLYTIIFIPENIPDPMPILIQRTPYNASRILGDKPATHLKAALGNQFVGNDFIYVIQDIRGRNKSEGEFVMYRPPRGPFNETDTDETTDAWDVIDWLVKNIESSGKVGVWGTSYPGWLTLAAMRDPHPALAAAVPFNPVVDVWKADDWFHWGTFRGLYAFDYIYGQVHRENRSSTHPFEIQDMYTWLLKKGALGSSLTNLFDKPDKMWTILMENPGYGSYWKEVAADQWFENPPRVVPALHVHGYWDQEDIYGSPAVYAALEKFDKENDVNFFAAGPWCHGQHLRDGSELGNIQFGENTARQFREEILTPFLRKFLHQDNNASLRPVEVFETGNNRWQQYDQWPPEVIKSKLYLQPGGGLAFEHPWVSSSVTEYISDPEHPIPYAPRPIWNMDYGNPPAIAKWRRWLVEDQRFVDNRPDVVTWVSEPLKEPLTVRGPITAHLVAETTGTDADWVVKFIDVYPDVAPDFEMSGYQLMVSGDIFRGRYREDYENPHPIEAGEPLTYKIPLPHINHTFLPGHRLMVQVQSTWFPLYDRNPQTFVPSIMFTPPEFYSSQIHRIHHGKEFATYLEINFGR